MDDVLVVTYFWLLICLQRDLSSGSLTPEIMSIYQNKK